MRGQEESEVGIFILLASSLQGKQLRGKSITLLYLLLPGSSKTILRMGLLRTLLTSEEFIPKKQVFFVSSLMHSLRNS